MAKDYPRSYRVADQIQRELSGIIRFGVKDPRVPTTLTIAGVEVSRDLASARVFVSMFGMEEDQESREQAVVALNKAAGYLRRQLGSKMRLRIVPTLHFRYDSVQEDAVRMSSLIDDAVRTNTTTDDSADSESSDHNQQAGDA